MRSLGSAQTLRTVIGAFEVRVGPLSLAGRLTSSHSVGVSDGFTISVDNSYTELIAPTPSLSEDHVGPQEVTLKFNFREFSYRNLMLAVGASVPSNYTTESSLFHGTLDTTSGVASGTSSLTVTGYGNSGSLVAEASQVRLLSETDPGKIQVALVKGFTTGTLVIQPSLAFTAAINESVLIQQVEAVTAPVAGLAPTVAVQLVQGKVVLDIWKARVEKPAELGRSIEEFFGADLVLRVLEPSDDDKEGDLAHLTATSGMTQGTLDLFPLYRLSVPADL